MKLTANMKLFTALIVVLVGLSSTASAKTRKTPEEAENAENGIHRSPLDDIMGRVLAKKKEEESASVLMTSLMEAVECEDCIHCFGGKALVDGVEMSCQDACDGDCCVGEDGPDGLPFGPCEGFTGVLERNRACSGVLSCTMANIAYVSNSCVGFGACALAGFDYEDDGIGPGTIGKIVNRSCVGIYFELNYHLACLEVGASGGKVDLLDDSCRGDATCIGDCEDFSDPGREFLLQVPTSHE
ncbi:hypothetical protein THAOC_24901 [Thalassiosira oceanica]|uniref:Uncharacterized protein n=1 Tax=Thalassiosira oceanica TaxID=159749 RepID=K0S9D5_THAOC|nr:hypothetical protein THAOC_24901 [Thalassiosira oceanica]|eukprot:EJK55372.1 hypothetical protein THAOC_24901 [Thalassiosira oceanica]